MRGMGALARWLPQKAGSARDGPLPPCWLPQQISPLSRWLIYLVPPTLFVLNCEC